MPWTRTQARTRWAGLGRFALAAVALPSCMLLVATGQEALWDDATVIHAGGGTFMLDRAIDTTLSGSPAMHTAMKRIGLKRACAILTVARNQAVVAKGRAFILALVATMRARIPPERLTGMAFPAFISGPLLPYKNRVSDALEHDAAPIYARGKANALARFTHDAAMAPAVSGKWAGLFSDWDLSTAGTPTTNAISIACRLYSSRDPTIGKRAFDVFYQRKETR